MKGLLREKMDNHIMDSGMKHANEVEQFNILWQYN